MFLVDIFNTVLTKTWSNAVWWQLTNTPIGATVNLQVYSLAEWEETMTACQMD